MLPSHLVIVLSDQIHYLQVHVCCQCLITRNLLISKDLQTWPKSCSAIFFVVTESSTRNRIAANKKGAWVLADNQESSDVSNRSISVQEYLKNLICATLEKSVWLNCGHPRHRSSKRNAWLQMGESPELRAQVQNKSQARVMALQERLAPVNSGH